MTSPSNVESGFSNSLGQCPHPKIDSMALCHIFYEGLGREDQLMVDVNVNGSILESTAKQIEEVFEMLAATSQHKGVQGKASGGGKGVKGVS